MVRSRPGGSRDQALAPLNTMARMRVVDGSYEPVTSIPYQRARSGGGREAAHLGVGRLRIDTLPDGCDAVIATGDLQGIAPSPWGGDPVLLGIALADHLVMWSEQGTLPPLERVGVILTGDLYSAPPERQSPTISGFWKRPWPENRMYCSCMRGRPERYWVSQGIPPSGAAWRIGRRI
jgi:hypothetical protein